MLFTPGAGVRPEPLAEGAHVLGPGERVALIDTRTQRRGIELRALTADGAPIEAKHAQVVFRFVAEEAARLQEEVSGDAWGRVIAPVLAATAGRLFATVRLDQLDTSAMTALEERLRRFAAEALRPYHVVIEDVRLEGIAIALPLSLHVLLDAAVLQEEIRAAPERLRVAEQKAVERSAAGQGVAAANHLLAPTLTPATLADHRARAWAEILAAPTTSIEVLSTPTPRWEVIP